VSLRITWDAVQLASILAEAEASGETRVAFDTLDDARRFRFACYNYRRRTRNGAKFSFIIDAGAVGRRPHVLVTRTPTFTLVRSTEDASVE
jgi:hypothetical protein